MAVFPVDGFTGFARSAPLQPTERVNDTVLPPSFASSIYFSLARRCMAGAANSSTKPTSSARAMVSSIGSVGLAAGGHWRRAPSTPPSRVQRLIV
jgi:hypothetical protein